MLQISVVSSPDSVSWDGSRVGASVSSGLVICRHTVGHLHFPGVAGPALCRVAA